ncbi:MAG: hypothetical protein DWQ05_00440 [Calditrichaeota bacterium]|nr:MAG: hypothetical protein DWQ05_00440 [Calditrichota bacterium]
MKRIVLFVGIMLLLAAAVHVHASDYKGGRTVHIAAGDTTSKDLMVAARNVLLEGVLLGDLFAAGENVTVKGDVGDDLFAAAKNLTIRGTVNGMLFGGGETVLIDSEIADDVFVGGGTVRITEKAYIRGNVFVGTGNLLFEGGTIEGNLKGGSGVAFFDGEVGGSIEWGSEKIEFGPNFEAGGEIEFKLPYWMEGKEIENVPANAIITYGERHYAGMFFKFVFTFLAAVLLGLCYVLIFKDFAKDQIGFAEQNVLQSLGLGFLALVATPVVIVILAVMVLSIPIALFVLAFYLMLLYLAGIISGLFLGVQILNRASKNGNKSSLVWALILGVFLLALLKHIPYIGVLISLIVVSFGMGSFLYFIWNNYKNKDLETAK